MAKYGFIAQIGADTNGLTAALKDVDQASKEINSELRAVNQALKLDPGNTVLAAQRLQLMGDAAAEAEKKLEILKSQQDAVNQAFSSGNMDASAYREYQRQIEACEATIRRYQQAQDDAAKGGNDLAAASEGVSKGLTVAAAAGKAAAAAIAAVGAAAVAGAKKLVDMAAETAAAGDRIDKQSQRLGMSAEAFQEWDFIMSQNGATIDNLKTGLNKLNNLVDDAKNGSSSAAENFKRLGLSMDEINSMGLEERFSAVIAALQNIDDESERNAIANDVLGKSYVDLIPLLNSTSESTEALRQKAHETGQIMSDESVKAAVNYTDAVDTMKRALDGFTNEMTAQMLPGLTEIAGGITDMVAGIDGGEERIRAGAESMVQAFSSAVPAIIDVFSGMATGIASVAPDIVTKLMDAISDMLPSLAETAKNIVPTMINAIVDMLPTLGECASEIVIVLLQAIVDALPDVINGALKIVETLANSLADALPEMVPAIVQAVLELAKSITENIQPILEAAKNIVTGLIQGITQALPDLIEMAPQIIIQFISACWAAIPQVVSLVPEIFRTLADGLMNIDWLETGRNMMDGLVKSFKDGWEDCKDQGVELCRDIASWFGLNLDDMISEEIAKQGYTVLGSQEEADKRLEEARKELAAKNKAIEDEKTANAKAILEREKKRLGEWKQAQAEIADEYSANNGEAEGVVTSAEMFEEEQKKLENKLATHKMTEAEYWEERRKLAEQYRDEDSEEWWKYYDEITAYYDKKAEADQKAAEEEKSRKEKERNELTSDYKKRFDTIYSQLKNEEITREEFNKQYLDLVDECAEKQVDISAYAADKIAEYDKKIREENLNAWEKSSQEITKRITKAYEDVTKAYEKARDGYIKSLNLVKEKITDNTGKERYILDDFKAQTKALRDYQKNLQALKATGIGDGLVNQIMSLSYDSGERQGVISEILNMSDGQRKKYYADAEAYYAEADKAAKADTADKLAEADKIAKEGIEKIYADMPKESYQKGMQTAQSYLQGIMDVMKNTDSLRLMGADMGTVRTTSAEGAAGGGNYYSGNMKIVIDVGGKQTELTLDDIVKKNILTGGNTLNV